MADIATERALLSRATRLAVEARASLAAKRLAELRSALAESIANADALLLGDLSEREFQCLVGVVVCGSVEEVAKRICKSPHTVSTYLDRCRAKFNDMPGGKLRVHVALMAIKDVT